MYSPEVQIVVSEILSVAQLSSSLKSDANESANIIKDLFLIHGHFTIPLSSVWTA